MQTHKEILELLDLGADVAENDTGLADYFVETATFSTILSGKVDVIRGHKGLGKSAIYKVLLSGKYSDPNTIIISASDATSSEIFRATQAEASTEDQFRLLWTAYLGSIIANEVCSRIPETRENRDELKQIKEFLKTLNLGKGKPSGSLIDSIKRTRAFGFGLGAAPDGMPTLNFNIELDQRKEPVLVSEEHFLALINMCVNVLRNAKQAMWILIDRLDELFKKNSSNEILSLRALLRSHLKICAIKQGQTDVRAKIFIRTDIYEKITSKEGFTNVTHFRDLNIMWNVRSILALVSKRVTANNDIVKKLVGLKVNPDNPNEVWDILVPPRMNSDKSQDWIAKTTSDSSGAFNPRNYITLLSLAIIKNRELLKTNPYGVNTDTALSSGSLISAYGELSRKRLDDTILAESPDVRHYVDKLRGADTYFDSPATLGNVLGMTDAETIELERVIERLIEVGLLKRHPSNRFSIAFLYRVALKVRNNDPK